jgi:hypothetical protein
MQFPARLEFPKEDVQNGCVTGAEFDQKDSALFGDR